MEQMILDSLNFDMALPTVHCFLTVFSKAMKCDRQTAFLANVSSSQWPILEIIDILFIII